MDPQFPLPSHNEGNGQVAIDMPGCDMNAPFGAPAPWDAANGQDQKQDYMLYVWIGLGVVVVIILLVCCCGGGKSGSSGKSRSFLSRLNPFAKEEPESCCSKYGKYGAMAALALATAGGGLMYYKKVQADAAARKKEEEDSEFAVKVWTISGVAGSVVLGAIWWKWDKVIHWVKLLGSKCGLCEKPTAPPAAANAKDAGATKSGKGIMAWFKSKLCSSKPGQGVSTGTGTGTNYVGPAIDCGLCMRDGITDRESKSPFACSEECKFLEKYCAPCINKCKMYPKCPTCEALLN